MALTKQRRVLGCVGPAVGVCLDVVALQVDGFGAALVVLD
jgi:hypothetical protein